MQRQLKITNPDAPLFGYANGNQQATPVPIHMTSFVLDSESKGALLDACHELNIDLNVNVYAHHLTINYKPSDYRIFKFTNCMVTHIVDGGPVQAARVDPNSIYSANKHPHVTLSCGENMPPKLSNDMLGNTGDWPYGANEYPYNIALTGNVVTTYDVRHFVNTFAVS